MRRKLRGDPLRFPRAAAAMMKKDHRVFPFTKPRQARLPHALKLRARFLERRLRCAPNLKSA
jgi:hypothetical protein